MLKTQFLSLSLVDQRAILKELRDAHVAAKASAKAQREATRLEKAQAKALKQEQAIMRAQLRLEKLLAKKVGAVGAKAAKANRKAGPVTITKVAA